MGQLNFETINDTAELDGDGQPTIVPVMVYDSCLPSDANAQKTRVLTTSALLTVSDLRYQTLIKVVNDTLTSLDSFVKNVIIGGAGITTKVMAEALTVADFRFLTQIKTINEALTVGDFCSTKQLKKLTETLTIFDEFLKTLIGHGTILRVVTESIAVQVVQTYRKLWQVLTTKELTIYDQDRLFSYNIRCNEAFSAIESFIKTINAKPPPVRIITLEDDIKIFNSFMTKYYSRVTIDEVLTTADDFPYWVMRCANLVDNMTLTDELIFAKLTPIKKILLSESLALDATFILRKLKIFTENLTVSDAGTQKSNIATVSASVVSFDQFIKSVLAGGKIFANVSSEGLVLADSNTQWVYRHKEFIETLTLPDSVNKGRVLMQLLTEVGVLTDSIVKAFGPSLFLKIQSEGITLVDSTYAVKYAYRRLDEPLTVSDTQSHVTWSVRTPSETISLVDSTGQARIVSRSQAETLALTDASIAYALRQKILVETLALIDPATRQQLQARIVDEPTAITDQQFHNLLRYQVASEALVLTDTQSKAIAKLRTMAESITVQDGTLALKISRRILMELLSLSDEAIPVSVPYVTLVVRNTLSADASPVLGVDNTIGLGSDQQVTLS